MLVEEFENQVKENLLKCGVLLEHPERIGVAVSGGADSVSLLTAVFHIVGNGIKVITVNHNIREEAETSGDADFVQNLCKLLGVECCRIEIERNLIKNEANKNSYSIEESARLFRYKAFDDFKKKNSLDCILLAHNKNDQIETLLMRFLSGGGTKSLCGIKMHRDFYIRPLLSISRKDIENYLFVQSIPYRTDASNKDNAMLRNRLRNILIPSIDNLVSGWSKAVLSLSEKMTADDEFIEAILCDKKKEIDFRIENDGASFLFDSFLSLHLALRSRIIYEALDATLVKRRFPYAFVKRVIDKLSSDNLNLRDKTIIENAFGIDVYIFQSRVWVKKNQKKVLEKGFFAFIENSGEYLLGDFSVSVDLLKVGKNGISISSGENVVFLENLDFPFLLRSRQTGDSVKTSVGGSKTVASVFTDWKCGERKDDVIVVQELKSEKQEIVALIGSFAGFPNWLVN